MEADVIVVAVIVVGLFVSAHTKTAEHDRQRLLAVERLILETICFNFTSRMTFPYVIKIGKLLEGMQPTLHITDDEGSRILTFLHWQCLRS